LLCCCALVLHVVRVADRLTGHTAELSAEQADALLARARADLPRECLEYLDLI